MPRLQQYFGKLERYNRHVTKIINYGTSKKLANILLAEWERGLASACVHSLATTRLSREIVPNS